MRLEKLVYDSRNLSNHLAIMEIIFDPQIFSLQKFGGISRYVSELAVSIFNLRQTGVEIFCPRYSSQYLKWVPASVFSNGQDVSEKRMWSYRRFFYTESNLTLYIRRLKQKQFDVTHHTYYWPLPDKLPVRARVTTIHDMIDEIVVPNPVKSRLKLRSVQQADHVICVSNYTRSLLLDLYNVSPEKVSVVYLGKPEIKREGIRWAIKERPYILFVGSRTGYKNFYRLLTAYTTSRNLKRDFRIVCFGGGPFTSDEMTIFIDLKIAQDDMVHLNGDDMLLHSVYRGAALFVYPSLCEGFGLPPLEAMALGTPVVCSNVTSIPEIVGGAGEYFEPVEIDSIRHAIENVLYSDIRRQELTKAGYKRAASFSWEKCASETLGIYRTII